MAIALCQNCEPDLIFGGRAGSMEVATPRIQSLQHGREVCQPVGYQVADAFLGFQFALYLQQLGVHQLFSLAFCEAAPNDDVDHAKFIFEGDEGDAAGGAGALSAGDQAGDADAGVVGHVRQLA